MNPSLRAIRALAVDFIMRLYGPVTIVTAGVAALLLAFSVWLTSVSNLWWILVTFVTIFTLVLAAIFITLWLIIKKVAPTRTKAQKVQARALVDKMQHLTEVATLPKFFLWFQIARDIVRPSGDGFIASVSNDTTSLHQDFIALRDSFR